MAYDVLIIGGGIMGSSTALNLVRLEPGIRVAVVEKDLTYAQSSRRFRPPTCAPWPSA